MSELKELISEFLEQLQTDSSVNTFKAYKSDLKYLENTFSYFKELKESNFKELRLSLTEKYSAKTVARKWSAWREFFRFCQLGGFLSQNPILNLDIESPNNIRRVRSDISAELITAICEHPESIREKALLWFMYSTGARPSELIKYGTFKNLNIAAREFYIHDRVTFLCERAYRVLQEYFVYRESLTQKMPGLHEHIFISDTGSPLKELFIYNIFSLTAQKLGIKASIGDLRDSMMLRLYSCGASPEELKYFLGFKSIKSIEPLLRFKPGAN
jgi:site-specific recombinase XerD